MIKFGTIEKKVGETPLEATEKFRDLKDLPADTPLAYAGRLDPMASGKLLILVGEECKNQQKYHHLDKEYIFEILLGTSSDSGDVLGLIFEHHQNTTYAATQIKNQLKKLIGPIELPYPKFSSKTVSGKPLHVWTLEGKIDTIKIPTKKSTIHQLELLDLSKKSRQEIYDQVTKKIETIPPVTEASKALGNDFRRPLVRESWAKFINTGNPEDEFQIAKIKCAASSGTYMRTLAEVIASSLKTKGLAYSIHRRRIGKFLGYRNYGLWFKNY